MKAYEIIECLNQLFSEFDRLAEASGVEKIKTSGTATWRSQASPRPIRTMREQQPNLRLI
ncbi:MAG: adenylate/guanylate cyclase domain-containing protein, partial [Pseudolabrys sp.]